MKILHTSDWHLGHELYGNDRTQEFAAMLLQMRDLVAEHRPDAFVICGDIFDVALPGNNVQKMFTEAIVKIHRASPETYIIVISGNHDSATRHEVFSTPWRALNVYSIGNLHKDNLEDHIIKIPGKGYVIAVPYINDRMLPDNLYNTLIGMVPADSLPIVLTAHCTVKGAAFDGHRVLSSGDDVEFIGNIKAVNIEELANGYDYLALGHIHKAQFIHRDSAHHHSVRYSGSPLAISFDEPDEHSVSLINIEKRGAQPQVDIFPIKSDFPLITLPARNKFLPWDRVVEILNDHECNGNEYIRLNVEQNGPLPVDRQKQIEEAIKGKTCKVCHINLKRPDAAIAGQHRVRTVNEFQHESPLTIAKEYAKFKGQELSEELIGLLNIVYSEIDYN